MAGVSSARDKNLAAVEDITVAVVDGLGRQGGEIRTGFRFRHADGYAELPFAHSRNNAFLLLFRSEHVDDPHRAHIGFENGAGDDRAILGHFLNRQKRIERRFAASAIIRRKGHAQKSHFAVLTEQVDGKLSRAINLRRAFLQLFPFSHGLKRLNQHPLFIIQRKIHFLFSFCLNHKMSAVSVLISGRLSR